MAYSKSQVLDNIQSQVEIFYDSPVGLSEFNIENLCDDSLNDVLSYVTLAANHRSVQRSLYTLFVTTYGEDKYRQFASLNDENYCEKGNEIYHKIQWLGKCAELEYQNALSVV